MCHAIIRRIVKLSSLPILLMAMSTTADADSAWSVFVKSGLAGNWAISCAGAPSDANAWVTYYQGANGTVRRKLNRGPGTGFLNLTIDSAAILDDGTIRASVRNDDPAWGNQNGTVAIVVIEIRNGHERSIQSRSAGGQQFIKDGVVVGNGKPSPSFEKCSD